MTGDSNQALTSAVVDMVACVLEAKGRMYMFASQIEEDAYSKTEVDLETTIASFQITQ